MVDRRTTVLRWTTVVVSCIAVCTGSQWASYQIRNIAGCACAGNAGKVFPRRRFQRKPLVSDPGMHHGTCATHVPWCMSGSLTYGDGENAPGIPRACAPAISRIWQEAHTVPVSSILTPSRYISTSPKKQVSIAVTELKVHSYEISHFHFLWNFLKKFTRFHCEVIFRMKFRTWKFVWNH